MRTCSIETLLLLTTFLVVSDCLTFFNSLKINQRVKPMERDQINQNFLPGERSLTKRILNLDAQKGNDVAEVPSRKYFDAISTPFIAGTIGVTAFCFQIFGIFPWHAKLQSGFESVEVNGSI
jgi:hypothetical protein